MKPRIALQLACLVLAGIAAAPWLQGPVAVQEVPVAPRAASQMLQNFHMPAKLDSYPDILARPVFVASRRMVADPAPVPHQANEVLLLDRYPVVGVVVTGDKRLVLIRRAAGDTVSRLEQGAELDGWTLTEVSQTRLVLEKDGQRKDISLRNNSGSAD